MFKRLPLFSSPIELHFHPNVSPPRHPHVCFDVPLLELLSKIKNNLSKGFCFIFIDYLLMLQRHFHGATLIFLFLQSFFFINIEKLS